MGGSSSNDSVGGSGTAGSSQSTSSNSSANSDKAESFSNAMSNAERPDRAPAAAPDKPDTKDENDRPESPNDDGGGRSMSNAERPDRAPATPSTDKPDSEDKNDRPQSPNDGGNEPARAEGPSGINEQPSTATPANAESNPTAPDQADGQENERGFFSGLTKTMQDFAKENPRVDSHGNPVGLIDADGVQRGEVASGLMASGTSTDELARQLGFVSPQEMAASQTTDFIDGKYQEQRAAELVTALEERYGQHPDLASLLQTAGLMTNFAPNVLNNPNMVGEVTSLNASRAFGDIEHVFNSVNTISTAEAKLRQGDIDGYYEEINKIDPYGDLALDVRQQLTPSGVIAADYYRDTLRKEGFTDQQIDDFWAKDTRALAFADLATRKAELGAYSADTVVNEYDGILSEDSIAQYHKDAMQDRYDNWTGKAPYEALGRWLATTPEARVQLANEMVELARSGDEVAQAWVDEAIADWNTIGSMLMHPNEVISTLPESLNLVGPALGIDPSDHDDLNQSP